MAIYTNSPFPRHYGSSSGHRQVVASSAPLIPVKSDVKTKESDIRNLRKVRRRKSPSPNHHSSPCRSSSVLNSASLSARSLSFHSDASLASTSPSPATGGPDVLPTSVSAKNSSTAWLHRSSRSSSAMLVRSLLRVGPGSLFVSFRTVAHRVFAGSSIGGNF